ncbi:permease [Clostridium senegalense]|uniref:Permease n=1 Tax=Clostridium senegalense TaxID=1465809 RepID=A0A6M0H528_9CLOT|nr:permease [Clostridium senegalense]NEU05815.1 permease [Clostridium senegalense]
MNNLYKILKRYSFFLTALLILIIIFFINPYVAFNTFESAKSNFLQMLMVLPPIMILLGLMDVWVPRKTLMKYMGDNSGALGVFFAMLIGSLAAGPMYAAFPFTAVLIKKGVKFSNIIIFMNAWCVTKISTLLFEISSLGYEFTLIRLIIDIPGVILMGYIVNYFMDDYSLKKLYNEK